MKKVFVLTTSLSVLIVAVSVAYYLVIFIPGKEKIRQEQIRITKIKDCQDTATESAQYLAKTKAEFDQNLKKMMEKDATLYSKDDYAVYYKRCLERSGISSTP